jgi:hypothetical protein
MSTATLFSFSALAGTIAGSCIILGTVFTDLMKTSKGTVFNFLGALIGLFGLTGFYLWQAKDAGIFGLVAYVVVFLGLALIACIDYWGAFFSPNLSEDELSRLGASNAMRATYISFSIFLIGEILFGISTIIVGVFPVIASVLFMIGFLGTAFRPVNQIITFVGLSLSGIGLIWWSVSLWSISGGS